MSGEPGSNPTNVARCTEPCTFAGVDGITVTPLDVALLMHGGILELQLLPEAVIPLPQHAFEPPGRLPHCFACMCWTQITAVYQCGDNMCQLDIQ
jgi:hypothetical protein